MSRVLRYVIGSVVAVATLTAPTTGTATASTREPFAVVSLGDSYISGEGGRWRGNALEMSGDRAGTDRAFVDTPAGPTYDPARVYGASAANGCHRSDVAEVHRVRLPFTSTINLACSGARTRHVLRASAGGESLKTEPPQNDQLAQVARTHRVSVIVLSIGGNDLGFSDIIQACLSAYFAPAGPPCAQTQQPLVNERMVTTRTDVGRTIDDIRATMAQAGYRHSSYRLVLQSYPAPQPAAADMRYGADDPQRLSVGNCPFRDPDVDWAHDQLVNQLDDMLRGVARDRQVQFLDVRDAFRGHELCSASARHSDGTPREATSEWVRWIDLPQQGDLFSESLHPNAYGHRALGRCLNMAVYTRVDVSCHGVPGLSTSWMYLRRLR